MERDQRKGRGEWRGVHSFKDITCDGDGVVGPKRNGGLKMGQTYWYYYELHDGTEIYNTAAPSTTSCPYLPGQPVNLLHVPTQINGLRERSASESAMTGEAKTMNPADKYLSPRPPPSIPRPQLERLNSSPALLSLEKVAKPVSSSVPKQAWSARGLLGLKATAAANSDGRDRGRLASPMTRDFKKAVDSKPSSSDGRSLRSDLEFSGMPGTMSSRDTSPQSLRSVLPRAPSPLRGAVVAQPSLGSSSLVIPDDFADDDLDDDDANFATYADAERAAATGLSPPPSRQFHRLQTAINVTKPLPKLPDEVSPSPVDPTPSLIPAPLQLTLPNPLRLTLPNPLAPRSHFSLDTISTGLVSPTDSHFSSICDDEEEVDPAVDDSFANNSTSLEASSPSGSFVNRFHYSLPSGDFASTSTLMKGDVASADVAVNDLGDKFAVRDAFDSQGKVLNAVSALDELLSEMGYLRGLISGK